MAKIGTQRIQTASGPIDVPIFPPAEVADPRLRIQLPGGVVGCYNLVTPGASTPLRIMTPSGIMGVGLDEVGAPPTNKIDFSTKVVSNTSNTFITADTADYTQVQTPSNGQGLKINFVEALEVGKTYTITGRVEIVTTVDDSTQIHIRNVTQAKYIATSLAVTQATTGTIQSFNATFSPTSANYTPGDVVELWFMQRWANSTHDSMEWRLYKDLLVT